MDPEIDLLLNQKEILEREFSFRKSGLKEVDQAWAQLEATLVKMGKDVLIIKTTITISPVKALLSLITSTDTAAASSTLAIHLLVPFWLPRLLHLRD